MLFFSDDEIFDIIGANIKVSANKKCITKELKDEITIWNNNTYGINEISSMSDMIYKWDLKIISDNNKKKGVLIGISSVRSPAEDFEAQEGHHYAYIAVGTIFVNSHDQWKCYGDAFGNNDIVCMQLDLDQRQLRFSVNGRDEGVAYDDIHKDVDTNYRLMVSMGNKDCGVEIVNFSKLLK